MLLAAIFLPLLSLLINHHRPPAMAPALRILDVSLGDVVSELTHERRHGFQGQFIVITRTTRVSCSSDDCDRFCM